MTFGRFNRAAALRGGILLGALAITASGASAQSTVTLTVAKDATIRGGTYASTKHGTSTTLATRSSDDATYRRRAVLTFDTETTMPAKSPIQSARLVLTVKGGNDETRPLSAHSVPISFDQEDVTWRLRNASASWTYGGGDITGTPSKASASATVGSQVTFDVTAMVQRVVNGDFGSRYARFLVADAGSSSRDSYREYHSRESSYTSARPRLIVTYGGSSTPTTTTTASDVVLTPSTLSAKAGRWSVESNSGAVSGKVVRHADAGAAKIRTASSSPSNYFEMKFQAVAGKPYRIWIRGKADSDDWDNDSVHVQFSGSVDKYGSAKYRIGSSSSTEVNLEECGGCGISGWKWEDNGWGGRDVLGPQIYFATTGTQTIRVQTREDGLAVDQIVLSPSTYLNTRPSATVSAPAPPPAPAPAPAPAPEPDPILAPEPDNPSSTGTRLRVLMWNLHHGVGTDGRYNIDRIATWMAKMTPDVIIANEVEKYTGWGNEDQPARYKAMLEAKTGRRWYAHFTQEFGNWSSNGKGHLILSVYPLESTARGELTPSSGLRGAGAVGQARITVNGRTITLVVSHLDPESRSMRLTQARETIRWAASFPENRIIAGDMNAWPDQSSIAEFNKTYKDSWTVAEGMGTATGISGISPFGATKNGRIDYIFFSRYSSHLVVKSSKTWDTRDSNRVMPSDHRPVVTTFEVR